MNNINIIILMVFMLMGMVSLVVSHESSHYQIFKQMGFDDIQINYLSLEPYTSAVTNSQSLTTEAKLLNAQAEIEGYHTTALILNLWLMVVIIIITIYGVFYGKENMSSRSRGNYSGS